MSRYRNTGFALGGAWSRAELNIDFLGTANAQVNVPNEPALTGLGMVLQGAFIKPNGQVEPTNPLPIFLNP